MSNPDRDFGHWVVPGRSYPGPDPAPPVSRPTDGSDAMSTLRRAALPALAAIVLAIAGCAESKPSAGTATTADGGLTGTLRFAAGDVQGYVQLDLDGGTMVLTYASGGGDPETESRPQDRDAELIDFLESEQALDNRSNGDGAVCMDAGSGSVDLTIGDRQVSETFDCDDADLPLEAMAVAGFDTDRIMGELY